MRSHFIQRVVDSQSSLGIQDYSAESFLKVWHYHTELELNVIHESTGTAFVGDSIEGFEPGDIVLIGTNLPHMWLNDGVYFQKNSNLRAKAHIIHFFENFAGGLLEIPEMIDIKFLLERAKLGIKFRKKGNDFIINKINKIINSSGCDRVIAFIDTIKVLSEQKNYKLLSSPGYINSFIEMDKERLVPVYAYIMNNFKVEISLDSAARQANMNSSSFSRYFKHIHKKTFIQFVNEIRIGFACKLLIEDKCISSACYNSGFNNISNFNRQFKSLKGINPSVYIKFHSKK